MLTLRELLLVLPPAVSYLPPTSDPDLLREGRRLAERDLALGQLPKDWPPD